MMTTRPILRSPVLGPEPHEERNGWLVTERFRSQAHERDQAWRAVAVADGSTYGRLLVEGLAAAELVARSFDLSAPAPGTGVLASEIAIYRLRPDLLFLHTAPSYEGEVAALLTTRAHSYGLFVTITDVTHGRSEIRVIGPDAPNLLSKVCGLDFHVGFPNLAARQTSLAKTRQLLLRLDMGGLPAYAVIGARSLAAYIWEVLLEAGAEWGSVAIGNGTFAEFKAREPTLPSAPLVVSAADRRALP